MASVLNTTKLNYHVERIIEEATYKLCIISPFIKLHKRLYSILCEKIVAGVSITVVYGKDKLDASLTDILTTSENVSLYYCKDLHAKIYSNGEEYIVTSLNLYEFSQINNYEIGILVDKSSDQDLFYGISHEVSAILKGSVLQKKVEDASQKLPAEPKVSITQLAKMLKINGRDIFDLLSREKLIERVGEDWQLTDTGKLYGGEVVYSKKFGKYIVWPKDIIEKS